MNAGPASCNKRKPCRQGIWSRAIPAIKPSDTLKLPNPFPGEKPFKVMYDEQPTPDMTKLMNYTYYRQWRNELDAFMEKRNSRTNPPKSNFPIYRNTVKLPEPKEKPIVTSKKYANVKAKVFNFFLMYENKK